MMRCRQQLQIILRFLKAKLDAPNSNCFIKLEQKSSVLSKNLFTSCSYFTYQAAYSGSGTSSPSPSYSPRSDRPKLDAPKFIKFASKSYDFMQKIVFELTQKSLKSKFFATFALAFFAVHSIFFF